MEKMNKKMAVVTYIAKYGEVKNIFYYYNFHQTDLIPCVEFIFDRELYTLSIEDIGFKKPIMSYTITKGNSEQFARNFLGCGLFATPWYITRKGLEEAFLELLDQVTEA